MPARTRSSLYKNGIGSGTLDTMIDNMKEDAKPHICEFVKKHLPHASLAEQLEAQAMVDRYLMVVYRIYLRLKHEGKFPLLPRDKTASADTVDSS